MAEELQLILTAVDKMSGQLEVVTKQMKGLELAGQKAQAELKKMSDGFATAGRSVLGYIKALASIGVATAFLRSSVKNAAEAQEAQLLLERQVKATGASWEQYSSQIQQTIKAVSDYAIVQDETAKAALTRMILVSGDVQASMKNLSLSFDLAKAKSLELSQAAELVARASTGNIEPLARWLPELQNLDERLGENATRAEKAELALKTLSTTLGGTMGTMTEAEKATRKFNLALGDMAETIGLQVLPSLSNLKFFAADVINLFTGKLNIDEELDKISGAASPLQDRLIRLNKAFQGGWIDAKLYRDQVAAVLLELSKAGRMIGGTAQAVTKPFQVAKSAFGQLDFSENIAALERLADSMTIIYTTAQNFKLVSDEMSASLGILGQSASLWDGQLTLSNENLMIHSEAYTGLIAKLSEYQNKILAVGKTKQITDQMEIASQRLKQAIILGSLEFIANSALAQNRKLYFIARAAAIGQATMDTYVAATAAFKVQPPWVGLLLGSIVTAAGLANIAQIISAPKPMETGGIVTRPTVALIGEAGPEAVVPLRESGGMPGGDTILNITFTGPVLGDRQQARQFAVAIDKELYELKKRNMSVALS